MARRRRLWVPVGVGLAAAVASIAAGLSAGGDGARRSGVGVFETVRVRRMDLDTTILVGGDLRPARQTTIKCEVEDVAKAGGTMIVSIVEEGAYVKAGDEICRLDSSKVEEMVRKQEIDEAEARSARVQAGLTLRNAEIGLREYRDGLIAQSTKELEGMIALARSDSGRQADRVAWAEAMADKGYLSAAQLADERHALAKARHEGGKAERELDVFRRFNAPKEVLSLAGKLEVARAYDRLAANRARVADERLANLRKQVAASVVRAPHDGFVVFADDDDYSRPYLEPGVYIFEGEKLFFLPDPSAMDVEVMAHETVGPRLQVGMPATIRLASKPGLSYSGRVRSIEPFPIPNWKEWDENLKQFVVKVRIDDTPPGQLPLMSATVEVDTGRIPDALAIPVGAMTMVDGRPCCYVDAPGGPALRAITTGHATRDFLEVTGGLLEGEPVLLRPPARPGPG